MRSVTYSMGVSLDGYIVGPDGFDGLRDGSSNDGSQPLGDLTHRLRVTGEQRLGRNRVHRVP